MRRTRTPPNHADADLLAHLEPQPAVGLGDGQTEQAERAHLLDDRVGHAVLGIDLGLHRPQPPVDETADGVQELRQSVGIDSHAGFLPLTWPVTRREYRCGALFCNVGRGRRRWSWGGLRAEFDPPQSPPLPRGEREGPTVTQ